jgi:glutathione S-transferase
VIKLYDSPLSGSAYKVRLFLAPLDIERQKVRVDLNAGDNRTAEHLTRNPRGQIPVLEDGETIVWDSQAILVYLARRCGEGAWLPLDPAPMAEVAQFWRSRKTSCCLDWRGRAR